MKNLEAMNLKDLQTMAKNLKVKNWWNMKKTDLIKALDPIVNPPKPETKNDKKDKKSTKKAEKKARKDAENDNDEDLITLKEICSDLGIKGTKARRLLREHLNGTNDYTKYNRWEWDRNDKNTIEEVKAVLAGKPLAK